jgi:hypothetical protein
MKAYHNTTEHGYKAIIESKAIEGGHSAPEADCQGRYAITNTPTIDCVYLSLYGNTAYGDVTLECQIDKANCKFLYIEDDDRRSQWREFSTLREAYDWCDENGWAADFIIIEHRGPVTNFKRI